MNSRRQFLRYLAASPLIPYLDLSPNWFAGGQAAAPAGKDDELIAAAKKQPPANTPRFT